MRAAASLGVSPTVSHGGPRTVGARALAVDAATVGIVSVAIAAAAHQLAFMSVFVPVVLVARFAAWARLPRSERDGSLIEELPFFALCTLLGAFNDWSSVVRHGVYAYTVPSDVAFSTIPLWMLLFWGMILRLMATVTRARALGATGVPDDAVRLGFATRRSAALRVGVMLVLVVATRQLIYRHHDDPVISWLPFAVALAVAAWFLRPTRHDMKIMALVAVVGPAIEVLYIQVGQLHFYRLGWLAGVPLWIALWWVLAIVIWKDLSLRAHALIGRGLHIRSLGHSTV
jgi:hypothetical protein